MSRQVGSPKGAKARADKLFSQLVRAPGRCIKCGTRENIQCAHVISRRFSNTRVDLDNAVPLCAADHLYFTDHPVEWGLFVMENVMSEEDYWRLNAKAHSTAKVNWAAEVERLKALAAEVA